MIHNVWHFCFVVLNFKLFQWTDENSPYRFQTGNHRLGSTMSELKESASEDAGLKYQDLDSPCCGITGSYIRHVRTHRNTRWEKGRNNTEALAHDQHQNRIKQNEYVQKYIPTKYIDTVTWPLMHPFLCIGGFVLESLHKIKGLLQGGNGALRSPRLAHLQKNCGE